MNKYSDDMKRALATYRDTRKKAEARYSEIKDLYGEEAVKHEAERQEAQLKNARAAAEAAIREAYSEGHYLAEQWGKPDGSQLTDDLKLFDAGMVTPEVFETLKARYRDNATMSAALKAKGQQLNAAAAKEASDNGDPLGSMRMPYNTRDIETAEDKMKYWDGLKKQAMDMLDAIDGTGAYSDPWTQAVGRALGAEVIDKFGE